MKIKLKPRLNLNPPRSFKVRLRPRELDLTGPIAFDTESTGLKVWKHDQPFAVSMCDRHGVTRYWEWPVNPYTRCVTYDSRIEEVKAIIENPDVAKVAHNAKFDLRMLELNCKIKLQGRLDETMFAMRVWNSLEPSLKLKPLAHKYLDYPLEDEKDLQKSVVSARLKGKKLGYNLGATPAEDYWLPRYLDKTNKLCEKYARSDVERTMGLHLFLQKMLQNEDLLETYEREMRLWYTVYRMEERGVRLWRKSARLELAACELRVERDKTRLFSIAGFEFNPESDATIAEIAFKQRGLTPERLTARGKGSTGWRSLLAHVTDPFIRALFDYRAAASGVQFFNQYLDLSVPDPLNDGGYVLRSSFEQSAASTGRFGSRQPNLQNVPTRDNPTGAEHPAARRPFGPRPGYIWYAFDYSQLEFRILAALSQDPKLVEVASSGRDIHAEVADRTWGGRNNRAALLAAINALELERMATNESLIQDAWKELGWTSQTHRSRVNCEMAAHEWLEKYNWSIVNAEKSLDKKVSRSAAKTVVYAKIYGGGATAVVSQMRCTLDVAENTLESINNAFPAIKEFSYQIQNYGRRNGYIINAYGRKSRVDPNYAYRAVNYVIQGGAADLIKDAMIRCDDYLQSTGLDAHMVLTVHDELVFEFRQGHNKLNVLRKLKSIMEDHGGRYSLPLPVDCSRIRVSWAEKEEIDISGRKQLQGKLYA